MISLGGGNKTDAIWHHLDMIAARPAVAAALMLDGSGLPFEGSEVPLQGSGLPFEGSGLPFEGSGPPFEGSGLPFEGSGLPFEGSRLSLEGSGLPLEGSGLVLVTADWLQSRYLEDYTMFDFLFGSIDRRRCAISVICSEATVA